jgi:hypothetical protein
MQQRCAVAVGMTTASDGWVKRNESNDYKTVLNILYFHHPYSLLT